MTGWSCSFTPLCRNRAPSGVPGPLGQAIDLTATGSGSRRYQRHASGRPGKRAAGVGVTRRDGWRRPGVAAPSHCQVMERGAHRRTQTRPAEWRLGRAAASAAGRRHEGHSGTRGADIRLRRAGIRPLSPHWPRVGGRFFFSGVLCRYFKATMEVGRCWQDRTASASGSTSTSRKEPRNEAPPRDVRRRSPRARSTGDRARSGEAKSASKMSTRDPRFAPQRGGERSHSGPGGPTRDQLYQEAKKNVEGRSSMNKHQLREALRH
jgi:hypothetical protein